MISKELFCQTIRMIQAQQEIDEAFSKALQTEGNGFIAFGAENKYLLALRDLLAVVMGDEYDYIEWWFYETDDYRVWSEDEKREWDLTEPGALYDFIVSLE